MTRSLRRLLGKHRDGCVADDDDGEEYDIDDDDELKEKVANEIQIWLF